LHFAFVRDGDYLAIKLRILFEYLSVEQQRILNDDKTVQTNEVLIYFGRESSEQADKLKKSLELLSKQYGGKPRLL
jgi:hypothetical protein